MAQAGTAEILDQPLNLDTLAAYLGNRYADRVASGSESLSEALKELSSVNIKDVRTLAEYLDAAEALALEYEAKHPPVSGDEDEDEDDEFKSEEIDGVRHFDGPERNKFESVGILRVAMQIASPTYLVAGEYVDPRAERYRGRLPKDFLNKYGPGAQPLANAPIATAPIATAPMARTPSSNAPVAAAPTAPAPIAAPPTLAPLAATLRRRRVWRLSRFTWAMKDQTRARV